MLSERLNKALAAGSALALLPLLKDWSVEELQALLVDLEGFTKAMNAAIQRAWEKTACDPSLVFNAASARYLDRLRDDKKMALERMASDICSVAIHYLEERRVRIEPEPE